VANEEILLDIADLELLFEVYFYLLLDDKINNMKKNLNRTLRLTETRS